MKVWKYGCIKKYKFELHFRMKNKTITKLLNAQAFSHLVANSHQVRTVFTVERMMVFDFNAHTGIQVDMIKVVAASKECWSGDLLPETL